MKRTWKALALVAVTLVLGTAVVLAQELDEAIIPIVEKLPEVPILFGIGGGVIVSTLISILKHFGIVRREGPISPLVANIVLSFAVVVVSSMSSGMSFAAAVLSSISTIWAAIGFHETVGHGVAKIVGNR